MPFTTSSFFFCLFHLTNGVTFSGFGKKSQPNLSLGLLRKFYLYKKNSTRKINI